MAFHRGPKIVTDSLVLSLDAANRRSYPGSGTIWYDLSGFRNNATLVNSPTFSATSNSGLFSFLDTSFQYATVPDIGSLSQFTVETWCRVGKSLTGKVTSVVTNQYDLSTKLNFSIGTNNAPITYNMTFGYFNGAWRNVTGFPALLNTWYHLVGTYNGNLLNFYNNGNLDTQLSYTGTPQSGGEIRIARRWDDVANSATNFFSGDISVVKIYNRQLSAAEVQQNYNALKSRFNL